MLTPADAEVVARDPAIPGLELVLDPDALLLAVQGVLAVGVPGLATWYVRYKQATSCIVGVTLQTASGTVDGYVKAHARGEQAKAAKALEHRSVDAGVGLGVALLDPPTVLLRLFPNDRHLRVDGVDGERLAYKPERRYVARTTARDGRPAVIKCYAPGGDGAARTGADHPSPAGPLVVPRIIGGSKRHRSVLLEWIDGQPLDLEHHDAVVGAGAALRALHRQPPPEGGACRDLRVPLQQAVDAITAVRPPLGAVASEVHARLADALVAASDTATIHGDFSADQVIACGDRSALVDLDALRAGAPLEDLASFRAAALRDALLRDGRVDAGERAFLALREGYGAPVDERELDARTAGSLLQLGAEPFRRRAVGWPAQVEAILGVAGSLL